MIVRPSVVLPQPDSPTMPRVSPGCTVKVDAVDRFDLTDGVLEQARLDREVLDEALDAEQLATVRRRCLGADGSLRSRSRALAHARSHAGAFRAELFGEVTRGAMGFVLARGASERRQVGPADRSAL